MSWYWPNGREALQPILNRLRGRFGLRTLIFLFRRRLAVFFAVATAVTVAALAVAQTSEPLYRADAEVLLGGPSVATEMARLRSSDLAWLVAERLHVANLAALAPRDGMARRLRSRLRQAELPAGGQGAKSAIIDVLRRNVSITHTPETLSLTISYSASDALVAARVANAYAVSYTNGSRSPESGREATERVISSATKPTSSVSLDPASALLIGLTLGSLLGLIAALVTELLFAGLTTGAEVQSRLWIRHLGSVPDLASALPDARSVLEAVVDHPQSSFTEAFRSITRAIRGAGANSAQVIAVACSVPGEGATTVGMAMARTLALGRQSVVLVDCDVRRRVSTMFGIDSSSAGLLDVLVGRATLDDALFQDAASGASVLPATKSLAGQPSMLAGAAMRALVQQLQSRFAVVLLMNGPLPAGTDVRWLAAITDAVLLIARWRSTPDTSVSAVLEQLRDSRAHVAGLVLNQVDIRRQVHYTDDEASVYQRQFSKYFTD